MRTLPISRMLWLTGTMLLAILPLNGCQTTSFPSNLGRDQAKNSRDAGTEQNIVRPGAEVEWAINSLSDQPGLVRSGKSRVGPDGAIVVGPYGRCKIAGLTFEQAGRAIEKQLSSYVKQPQVIMAASAAASAPTEIVWRKATPLAQQPQQSFAANDAIRPVAYQSPPPTDAAAGIPVLGVKENDSPAPPPLTSLQPAGYRYGASYHGRTPPPAPPPDSPSEQHPILLPSYIIRPPDVLLIESQKGLLTQPIRGQHLVRPDGTVGVGIYGSVLVGGKTITQARDDIAKAIHAKLDPKQIKLEDVMDGLSVDMLAYNSTVYYIITDGAGLGEQVYRFPVMGSETVLDAISNINGLPVVASTKRIWLARRTAGLAGPYNIYPVDWKGITQQGVMGTNWQILPGDRIYVQADAMRRFNNNLGKFLDPVERVLGAALLGGQAVNAAKGLVP